MTEAAEPRSWETRLPLLSRIMLVQWTGAMVATWALVMLLLGVMLLSEGEADVLGRTALLMGACVGGLWLLGLLIMAVLLRGRVRVRYTMDGRGIRLESIDSVARGASRMAIAVGGLAGKPGVAGAGLLATSRETEDLRWSGALRAVYRPRSNAILLRNSWRTLMWVQCRSDNYAEVAAAMEGHLQAHGTRKQLGPSRLLGRVGDTLLVTVAVLPLLALSEPFDTGLLVPIFIYCFALATVWLAPLFAYAVLGGIGLQATLVLVGLFEARESSWLPGERYRGFEVLDGEELGLLLAAAAAAAALVWLSWRYLTGRSLSTLMADTSDMAGG